MALSLGTLFVKLSADPSELQAKLEASAVKVQKFAASFDRAAKQIGKVGLALTALGTASIRTASQFDAGVRKATDDLSNTYNSLATEVGRMLIPAIQAINNGLTIVFNLVKQMDPETKKFVGTFGAFAVGLMALAPLISKLIFGLSQLYQIVATVIGGLVGLNPVMWGIVAVIAVLVAVVPVLYKVMKENTEKVAEAWANLKTLLAGYIDAQVESIQKLITWTTRLAKVLSIMASVSLDTNTFGVFKKEIAGLQDFVASMKDETAKTFENVSSTIVSKSSSAVSNFKTLWSAGVSEIAADLKSGMSKLLGLGGAGLEIKAPKMATLSQIEDYKKRKLEAEQAYFKEVEKMEEASFQRRMQRIAKKHEAELEAIRKERKVFEEGGALSFKAPSGGFVSAAVTGQNKMQAQQQTRQGVVDQIISGAIQSLGDLGGAVSTFANTLSNTGDPLLAAASTLVSILPKLKGFEVVIKAADDLFGILVDSIGKALLPAFMAVAMLFKSLGAGLKILSDVMGPVLTLIFKIIATVIGGTLIAVGFIAGELMKAVAGVLDAIAFLIGWLLGDVGKSLTETAQRIRNSVPDVNAIGRMIDDMWNDRYSSALPPPEPIDDFTDSTDRASAALDKLTESLTNAPAGFKVAAARFAATNPAIYELNRAQNPLMSNVNVILDSRIVAHAQEVLRAKGRFSQSGIGGSTF